MRIFLEFVHLQIHLLNICCRLCSIGYEETENDTLPVLERLLLGFGLSMAVLDVLQERQIVSSILLIGHRSFATMLQDLAS